MNPSRLRPGSGLGLGFGAFLTSFLPLSLLPMPPSSQSPVVYASPVDFKLRHLPGGRTLVPLDCSKLVLGGADGFIRQLP